MKNQTEFENLPEIARVYVERVSRKSGWSRRVRDEVRAELAAHFADALRASNGKAPEAIAADLVGQFGEAKRMARLIRRGKSRCRPLWLQGIVRLVQLGAGVAALMMLYALYLNFAGRPVVTVDYLAKMNERVAPPGATPEQNAWPLYLDAALKLDRRELVCEDGGSCSLCGGQVPLIPMTPAERASAEPWIRDNEDVWLKCLAGSRMPWCWRTYEPRDGDTRLYAVGPAHEIDMNWLFGTFLPTRWRLLRDSGDIDGAIETALVLTRIGAQTSRPGGWTTGEQEYGLMHAAMGCQMLRDLAVHGLSQDQLQSIRQELERLFPDGLPPVDPMPMKWAVLDLVQHSFTPTGILGGHVVPRKYETVEGYFPGFNGYEEDSLFMRDVLLPTTFTIAGFFTPGREATEESMETGFAKDAVLLTMTPYERHARGLEPDRRRHWLGLPSIFRPIHPAWFATTADLYFMDQAELDATLTVIALAQYKQQAGSYPDDLGQLLGNWLHELPRDPFSDGCLRYARRGDGYILYSIGADSADNGGVETPGGYMRSVGNLSWGFGPEGGDRVLATVAS